jgi:methylphosphotriester-DNA--protein-cysteine methyltransferase
MRMRIYPIALTVLLSAAILNIGCGRPSPAQVRASQRHGAAGQSFLYVGSANSNVYHDPTCLCAQRIKPGNLVRFRSATEALARGYRPCKICRPPTSP